jgi:hypothetical protein
VDSSDGESGTTIGAIVDAEAVLDRVYGRPKQSNEISGPDQGAITIEAIAEAALLNMQKRELDGRR